MNATSLEVVGLCRFLRFCSKRINMPFYAVARGRKPGIYDSWEQCKLQTDKFPKALYKSFKSEEEAVLFCQMNGGPTMVNSNGSIDDGVIEIMDSDDNSDEKKFQALDVSAVEPSVPETVSSHNSFDFASFAQRLTSLEDTYKKKMKQLEERIEALEDGRLLSGATDIDFSSSSPPPASKPSRSASALKRSSSKADFGEQSSLKKPKTSQKIRVTSVEGKSYEFEADGDGFVKIYTDGACSKNGRYDAKAGVGVWFGDDHPLNIGEPVEGRATNNMAEIQAATWAIQQGIRAGLKKICIYTDSKFTINSITTWIKKWKRNGWKTGAGDVINKEELEVLDKVVNYPGLNVKWEYVKGHAGHKGNERADALAREGAEKYGRSGRAGNHPWQQYFAS